MKKILLATTALIGIGVSTATIAGSSGPTVSVGGFIDFQAGGVDQDFDTAAPFNREFKFQNDTEITVSVEGQSDNGLKYGAVIELNADISADGDGDGGNADKSYIWLETTAGRVELGGNSGAPTTMGVSAATVARATGGIDGDWYDFVSFAGGPFIITQELPAAHAAEGGVREDATKITYYTPRYSGFQLGLSYTPDEGDSGTAAAFSGDMTGDIEHVFSGGISYSGQVDQVGIEAAIIGEFGQHETAGLEDVSAWSAGLALSWDQFSLAGSWTDWGDSGLATGASPDDQDAWTLGAAYEDGPWGVSVTYLNSESVGNDTSNLSLGADYQLAPGLVPYIEASFFELDSAALTTDNEGTVLLVGAELSF